MSRGDVRIGSPLTIPRTRLYAVGDRAFHMADDHVTWNSLPRDVT